MTNDKEKQILKIIKKSETYPNTLKERHLISAMNKIKRLLQPEPKKQRFVKGSIVEVAESPEYDKYYTEYDKAYTHNTSRKVKKGKVFDIEKLKEKIKERIEEVDKIKMASFGLTNYYYAGGLEQLEWLLKQINKLEEGE